MRNVCGYLRIIAFAPSLTLSPYCSTFWAVTKYSCFSPAKGSGRRPPFLKSGATVVKPPVHSGMVPSLLPAFSAPNGVKVDFRRAASSAVTAAEAFWPNSAATTAKAIRHRACDFRMDVSPMKSRFRSECAADRERDKVAVVQRLLVAVLHHACRSAGNLHRDWAGRAIVVGVGRAEFPNAFVQPVDTNADVAAV